MSKKSSIPLDHETAHARRPSLYNESTGADKAPLSEECQRTFDRIQVPLAAALKEGGVNFNGVHLSLLAYCLERTGFPCQLKGEHFWDEDTDARTPRHTLMVIEFPQGQVIDHQGSRGWSTLRTLAPPSLSGEVGTWVPIPKNSLTAMIAKTHEWIQSAGLDSFAEAIIAHVAQQILDDQTQDSPVARQTGPRL